MSTLARSYLFPVIALVLAGMALHTAHLTGDGGEYLLMTHALFKHGSAAIGAADVADYAHMAPQALQQAGMHQWLLDELLRQAQSAKPEVVSAGFFPDASGRFYAIHFWFYSLLALPFYALLKPLGFNPAAAFVALNVACTVGVFAWLARIAPRIAPLACAVFLVTGTTFYLRWTGPEVMTASCALIATLAMLRGEAALAILLAGIGASQNPPLLILMPFAVLLRVLLAKYESLRWPGVALRALRPSDALPALAGVILALAPMAFFQHVFGVPSLIAKYMTSTDFVTPRRFLSLYLDLDQGMIVGVPAILLALLLPPLLLARGRRRAWLLLAALTVAMMVAMSLPALSASNWNSGCSVLVRYAYWLAMPLVALALRATVEMSPQKAKWLLLAIVLGQLPVIAANGVFGERSSHVGHSRVAQWLLDRHPSRYNPEPEIFYERDVGHETVMLPDLVHVHRVGGEPVKLLRHWSNFESSAGLCPDGQQLLAGSIVNLTAGWQYLHPPFNCRPAGSDGAFAWRFKGSGEQAKDLLAGGWSVFEGTGVWSDGLASGLKLPVPGGRQPVRLRVQGFYYGSQRGSEVSVNGVPLGTFKLPSEAIELPAALRGAAVLEVTLRHPDAQSPKARGESPDGRVLGFYLQTIVIETELAGQG